MDDSTKLDEILAIVRNIRSLDSTVIEMRSVADEARESEKSSSDGWIEVQANGQKAALLAWDLLDEARKLMNATDKEKDSKSGKDARSKWAERVHEFLLYCRKKSVWMQYEDPYYGPNQDN